MWDDFVWQQEEHEQFQIALEAALTQSGRGWIFALRPRV